MIQKKFQTSCLNTKKDYKPVKVFYRKNCKVYEATTNGGGSLKIKIKTKLSKDESLLRNFFYAALRYN